MAREIIPVGGGREDQHASSGEKSQRGEHGSDARRRNSDTLATPTAGFLSLFRRGGKLRPFRLLKQDVRNTRERWLSDWAVFNQLVLASAVYVFFTNILPGITFASDLYVLTGKSWGTIEVIFSTGLCSVVFSM